MVVRFHDDDRQKVFDFSTLPLPGWHEPLAAAFAARTGPVGGLRTLASATYSCWNVLRRFLIFLDERGNPPTVPGQLTAGHLEKFLDHRHGTVGGHAQEEVQALSRLFDLAPMAGLMDPAALDFARRRTQWKTKHIGVGGYSDGEFTRLTSAARTDVAAIRDRITAGEVLLERFTTGREQLDEEEALRGQRLAEMAAGLVPWPPGHASQALHQRKKWASELFFTRDDLAPCMVLFVAVTGLNSEAVKELSADHRIVGDRAVETTVVKRRRGQGRWFTKVTWEIGEPNRQLHTPGGLYLLMLRLTARSREFSGSSHVLTVWRNSHRTGQRGSAEHYAPFAKSLAAGEPYMRGWSSSRARPVFADAPDGVEPKLLKIDLNRVRTSVEARRTKQMGGHLPSAARSNSMQVLFRHYLSGDPVIREWADDVLAEALVDAEQAAVAAHQRALRKAGGALRVLTTPGAAAPQAEDTAWTASPDMDRHPVTGSPPRTTS
ncbi:hypothetical protein [Streptomyces sp. BF23-19]|uniref:hypothetical protein n=1 Tax=unclassified Streptomyces TaxID=2593676 RepID=UPI0034E3D8BA